MGTGKRKGERRGREQEDGRTDGMSVGKRNEADEGGTEDWLKEDGEQGREEQEEWRLMR